MKYLSLLCLLLISAAPLAAQGPGRAGLSARPIAAFSTNSHERVVVRSGGGLTRSERGALIGAIVGILAGAALSYGYDERGFMTMFGAGVVMAIPVSLIGALIGMM